MRSILPLIFTQGKMQQFLDREIVDNEQKRYSLLGSLAQYWGTCHQDLAKHAIR